MNTPKKQICISGVGLQIVLWKRWHWKVVLGNERILKGKEMMREEPQEESILGRRPTMKKKEL